MDISTIFALGVNLKWLPLSIDKKNYLLHCRGRKFEFLIDRDLQFDARREFEFWERMAFSAPEVLTQLQCEASVYYRALHKRATLYLEEGPKAISARQAEFYQKVRTYFAYLTDALEIEPENIRLSGFSNSKPCSAVKVVAKFVPAGETDTHRMALEVYPDWALENGVDLVVRMPALDPLEALNTRDKLNEVLAGLYSRFGLVQVSHVQGNTFGW